MGIYYCAECEQFIDDDRDPGVSSDKHKDTELVCPDCAEKLEDDD